MINNSVAIFKCLSDNSRLRIISNLLKKPMYVELLSEILDLSPSTISFHLKKMETCGLVSSKKDQYYVVFSVNEELLNKSLKSFINIEGNSLWDERQKEYEKKILKSFFKFGKLISIPVQRKKRIVILKEIAKTFELDKEYSEREVNIIIADYHDDFCTIRRELVGEKLLARNKSIYIKEKSK